MSKGDFLFIFDNTIATFVDMSQLKFTGGMSTLIPSKFLGSSINLFSFKCFY